MDAIDAASSDVEESQATQMLIDLIPRSSSVADPMSPVPATKIQSSLAPDVPESFASSRHSNSLPTYHYHGLASTQTQTQTQAHDEGDIEMQEGSQKENIQSTKAIVTTNEVRQLPLVQKIAPNVSSSKATASRSNDLEQIGHSRMSHSKTRTPNTRPVAINSLDPPSTMLRVTPSKGESGTFRKTPSRTLPLRPGRRKPSPAPFPEDSQDSFAHDPLQNAEELFVVGNELLKRPLSELGRVDSPKPEDFVGRSMSRRVFDNPVIGKAILESTPSQSSSQSQEPTQIITKHYGLPSATSAPSGRSSPPFPSLGSSGGASCFEDGTQRSEEHTQQTQPTQLVGGALIAATAVSEDVLNLVPGGYRSRLGLQDLEDLQETQPTTAEELQFPRRPNFAMPSRSTHATAGTSIRAQQATATTPLGDTTMDEVIPDSEPPVNPMSPMAARKGMGEDDGALPRPPRGPAYKGKGRASTQHNETEGEEDELLLAKSTAVIPLRGDEEEDKVADEGEESGDPPPGPPKSGTKGRQGMHVARGGRTGSSATPVTRARTVHGSAPSAQKRANPKSGTKAKATRGKAPVKTKGATLKAPTNHTSDSSFVPSSLPQQDYATASAPIKSKKAAKQTPAKTPAKTPGRSKRSTTRKNYQELTDNEEVVEETDPGCGPSTVTSGHDDEATPEEEYSVEPAPGAGRKRKRGTTKPAIKQEGNKRPRPEGPIDWEGTTRVYAFWAPTDIYYPGRIHSRIDEGTFSVKFDDGHDAELPLKQIRQFKLIEGDRVFFKANQLCSVVNVDPEQERVTISIGKRTQDVSWGDVKIPRWDIEKSWEDRTLEPTANFLKPKRSKNAILAGTGVVVTLHKACVEPRTRKLSLQNKVGQAGGTSIDHFLPHLRMDGKYDCGDDRWRISKKDVKWTCKDIDRLFLVSDAHNQKPRYLFAIALGIPCLSEQWLSKCIDCRLTGLEPDWNRYLLPQATIEEFGNLSLSQQVDLAWGENPTSLINIMDNKAPCKLFKGASILCVGKDMLPVKTKSEDLMGNPPPHNILPRIVLCMGAERVESVLTPSLASATLDKYTYIVTNTFNDPKPNWAPLPAEKWVDWAWVRSCLLTSRLLPRPDTPYTEPESQDI